MTTLFRIGVACALSACIAGCVAPGTPAVPTATVTPLRTKVIAADSVRNAILIGKSTRADVLAALGETLIISFDSGFEVWVYRLASDTPARGAQAQGVTRIGSDRGARAGTTAEFVVLFAPSGLVAKTRIRPAPPRMKDEG